MNETRVCFNFNQRKNIKTSEMVSKKQQKKLSWILLIINNNDLFLMQQQNEMKKFQRLLDTNYKYACLVTLTMDLLRGHDLYEVSRKLAKQNKLAEQKNYGIVLLRLGLLFKYLNDLRLNSKSQILDIIFSFLEQNLSNCLLNKYKSLFLEDKLSQIDIIKAKFHKDIKIFKFIFENTLDNFQETVSVLTQLYKLENKVKASKKQLAEAQKLASILIGVVKFGQNYKKRSFQRNASDETIVGESLVKSQKISISNRYSAIVQQSIWNTDSNYTERGIQSTDELFDFCCESLIKKTSHDVQFSFFLPEQKIINESKSGIDNIYSSVLYEENFQKFQNQLSLECPQLEFKVCR